MRLRKKKERGELILEHPLYIKEPKELFKGKWLAHFPKYQAISIEIGVGRGAFIKKMAELYPNILWIGIDRLVDVLYQAAESALKDNLTNVRFIHGHAEELNTFFARNELSSIYIQFPDPWPKNRHGKRRLTSNQFLAVYQEILASNGIFVFKTDNEGLFEYSLNQFLRNNWQVRNVTLDLHENLGVNLPLTNYEATFMELGKKIYYFEAINKKEMID